ncbi:MULTISPECIES: DUF3175 domain-containing protein [Ralstonia solanacearum species complex]|uniref:DUF3175 domain-containing protein n=1 Tax=Ralstonia solanacearum species complex TaxID=3116862 RepID=UPI0013DDAD8C|nr:DUF3175 domain-containing protein [Ralstonia solanacearum]
MSTSRTKATLSRARKPAAASASRSQPTAKIRRKNSPHRWSRHVTATSDALDLEPAIFKSRSPDRIAASLKASAERSRRRKGTPFQSAMSMLTFYINRAGHNLSDARRAVLERAKDRLRIRFGRPGHGVVGKGRRH